MAEKLIPQMVTFVKFQLADKHCFAPFTGQDYSAWHAFVYAVELYGRGDATGQEKAIDVMRACVHACQLKDDVLAVFKKAIPGVTDWGFEGRIWTQIAPRILLRQRERLAWQPFPCETGAISWPCEDGPRICSHIHSKPSKKRAGWFDCKSCGAIWQPAIEAAS